MHRGSNPESKTCQCVTVPCLRTGPWQVTALHQLPGTSDQTVPLLWPLSQIRHSLPLTDQLIIILLCTLCTCSCPWQGSSPPLLSTTSLIFSTYSQKTNLSCLYFLLMPLPTWNPPFQLSCPDKSQQPRSQFFRARNMNCGHNTYVSRWVLDHCSYCCGPPRYSNVIVYNSL